MWYAEQFVNTQVTCPNMRPLLCLIIALFFALPGSAQTVLRDVDLRFDTRYDNIDNGRIEERLQGAIRLGLRVDFNGFMDLVAFMSTGNKFTSRWSTLRDYNGGQDADPLAPRIRHVYLQKVYKHFRIQAGAIPPVKNVVSPTGLEPVGWIDGARFEWYNAESSAIELVIGRLGSLRTPNAFARPTPFLSPQKINYVELEASQQVTEQIRLEGSAEYFKDPFLRGEIRLNTKSDIETIAEALVILDSRVFKTGLTVQFDVLKTLFDGQPDRLTLMVNHAYKDDAIGLRGQLADDFFTFGHSVTIKPAGTLSKLWGLRWAVEAIFAEQPDTLDPELASLSNNDIYTRLKIAIQWRVR